MIKSFLRLPGLLNIAALLLFTTCQKDKLPPETQEGANTFGCKVNGKAWVPNGGAGFMGAKPIEGGFIALYDKNKIRTAGILLMAQKQNGEIINIFSNDYRIGKYNLNEETNIFPFTFYPKNYGMFAYSEGSYYTTKSSAIGNIVVTKSDTLSGILSGTFEFKATLGNSNDAVEITSGRFDINVKTLK